MKTEKEYLVEKHPEFKKVLEGDNDYWVINLMEGFAQQVANQDKWQNNKITFWQPLPPNPHKQTNNPTIRKHGKGK